MKIFWILILTGWTAPVMYAVYLRKRLEIVLAMLEEERRRSR